MKGTGEPRGTTAKKALHIRRAFLNQCTQHGGIQVSSESVKPGTVSFLLSTTDTTRPVCPTRQGIKR